MATTWLSSNNRRRQAKRSWSSRRGRIFFRRRMRCFSNSSRSWDPIMMITMSSTLPTCKNTKRKSVNTTASWNKCRLCWFTEMNTLKLIGSLRWSSVRPRNSSAKPKTTTKEILPTSKSYRILWNSKRRPSTFTKNCQKSSNSGRPLSSRIWMFRSDKWLKMRRTINRRSTSSKEKTQNAPTKIDNSPQISKECKETWKA